MKASKRMTLLVAALLVAALLVGCGAVSTPSTSEPQAASSTGSTTESAPEYIMTIAISTAEQTGQYVLAVEYGKYVEEHSNGRIKVNVYPNAQLGGDREVLEAIQNNEITITGTSTSAQANFVPDLAVFDRMFTFPNTEALRKTLNDETLNDLMSEKYKTNSYHFLGFTDVQFRVTSSNKAFTSPSELGGLKIRTMENKFHMDAWKALGANPTPLAFNELYTALQQGTVDAQENPVELIVSQKFYEQQDYVILTNHLGHVMGWVMSQTFYDSLPDDLKAVADEGFAACLPAYYEYVDSNISKNLDIIRDSGTEIIELSAEQLAAFAALTTDVDAQIEAAVDPAIYAAYEASLAG